MMGEGLLTKLDTSHTIHTLSFGDWHYHQYIQFIHPNASLHPLQNASRSLGANWTSRYMHYHLDVIPTIFNEGRKHFETYQYIWRFNQADADELPAVYFQYAIGGVAVEVNRNREPWWTFLI
jgi:hypothetical protein